MRSPNVLGLSLALLLSGCSASYMSERLFWKAWQLQRAIVQDPGQATPAQVANAIRAFERVTQRAPQTVWAARASLNIGALHVKQGRYPTAREAYAQVLQNYSRYPALCLAARLSIAKTYEAEQQWDAAVQAYQAVSEYHAFSRAGLEAPLYVAASYEQRNQQAEALTTYERAVRMYSTLIPATPTSALQLRIKGYLALAYQRLGQWSHAIGLLEELMQAQAEVNRPLVLLSLGSIYQARLGEPEKAKAAYTKLLEEFPEHPFGNVARTRLEHLTPTVR